MAHFLGDLSQIEKLSEIKPPLVLDYWISLKLEWSNNTAELLWYGTQQFVIHEQIGSVGKILSVILSNSFIKKPDKFPK